MTIPRTVLYSPVSQTNNRGHPPSVDTFAINATQRVAYSVALTPTSATEDYEYYGNLTTKEWPELDDDLTTSTEVPNTSTVEEVTRKRLKRRKTTTSDPATSTKRRLKRTRTTTVGQDNA
ncbi:hypothetical protein quinque_000631 [Culex quinquefasciatus]